MKKLLLLTSALCIVGSYAAAAQISVSIGEPVVAEPAYVMRPDYPSEHYDIHRHRHNDYWARKQQDERNHAHEEHR